MNCQLCGYKAIPYSGNKIGDTFYTISWELVDQDEYKARLQDGRTTKIHDVCPACYEKYTGKEARSTGEILHALNEKRTRENEQERKRK